MRRLVLRSSARSDLADIVRYVTRSSSNLQTGVRLNDLLQS